MIGAGSVKHEVPETHVDVRSNLLNMLFRIRRHDPAPGGALSRKLIRKPLHFKRILDRDLLLGRERQRRPVAGTFPLPRTRPRVPEPPLRSPCPLPRAAPAPPPPPPPPR